MDNFIFRVDKPRRISCITLFILLSIAIITTHANPFNKGNTTATVALGSGSFFNEDYLIIGGGLGYFIADGLEAGLDIDIWTGGNPSIYEVTPKLTYIHENESQIHPYIGVFYNRTFVENFNDSDAIGYKAGIFLPINNRLHLGIGMVRTELQDCVASIFSNCSESYTELMFLFSL